MYQLFNIWAGCVPQVFAKNVWMGHIGDRQTFDPPGQGNCQAPGYYRSPVVSRQVEAVQAQGFSQPSDVFDQGPDLVASPPPAVCC